MPVTRLKTASATELPHDKYIRVVSERDSPEAGKPVRMDVCEHGYHDFCMGPQGHPGRKEPLLDLTLDALEKSVQFVKGELR
jgi:hypothetical protein